MLLAHLLPFLNAEIDRLQKARDLLAYVPAADTNAQSSAAAPAALSGEPSNSTLIPADLPFPAPPLEPLFLSAAAQRAPTHAEAGPAYPRVIVRKLYKPRKERSPRVRKYLPASGMTRDSALTGAVPAGPVVVSAEDVRKTQAAKVLAPRPTNTELSPAFAWVGGVTDVRKVEALLQKLIDGGAGESISEGQGPRHIA